MRLRNLHYRERGLRFLLSLILLLIGWSVEAERWIWVIPLRLIALYPLLTAVTGWSPLRSLAASYDVPWRKDETEE